MSSTAPSPNPPPQPEALRTHLNNLHAQQQELWNAYIEMGITSYSFCCTKTRGPGRVSQRTLTSLRRAYKVSSKEHIEVDSELWLFQSCSEAECKAIDRLQSGQLEKSAGHTRAMEACLEKLQRRVERLKVAIDEVAAVERAMLVKRRLFVDDRNESTHELAFTSWTNVVHEVCVESRKRRNEPRLTGFSKFIG
ncbi:hypothetical protein KC356_g7346 [Hortaea werneckii]|nr:hypothetical protein KC356_g7346 [Hortaea werneckii]KAI7377333.1 hypothetical protein KC336_g19577 [Hortaea werneckii]